MRWRAAALAAVLAALLSSGASAQISGAAALWGTQGASCAAPSASEAKPWKNKAYTPECRARYALGQFRTLDEKFRYLAPAGEPARRWQHARDVAALLDLPSLPASDGPAGLAGDQGGTAFPTPLAIAATFDTGAAARYGDVIGTEFGAAGLGTMLGPALDIARSWRFGRLTESFGEDPFLMAEIATAEIRAIQARGVITTMKHYAAYAQDAGRVGDSPTGARPAVNVMLSERALREIYLPGFEAAVKIGGAGGVMCSFPRINGVYACENTHLFDILKREWGFDGLVMPDFPSAQRSITRAFLAGLDSGSMRDGDNPRNAGTTGEKGFYEAVRDGEVPEARIDDIILRRLIPAFRVGQMDEPPVKAGQISTPANRAAAAELVAEGAVLLKNEHGILPLGAGVRHIAVIGAQATDKAVVVEQGSPWVKPAHLQPVLPAIRARAGAVEVSHAAGTLGLTPFPSPPAGLFQTSKGEPGFRATYFASPDFRGMPIATRTEKRPYLDKTPDIPKLPANNQWSVRYQALLIPAADGVHKFSLHGSGSARLWVNGERRVFSDADFGSATWAHVPLRRGVPVEVQVDYMPRAALGFERRQLFGMNIGLTLELGYAPPDDLIAEAAAAAKAADVAVVFVGEQVGEGMDRGSLRLQSDQDALIEAVARANPNTVVVLTTGGPVAMPWLDRVAAVLEMWLPGDAFGPAAASLLFGDREPGGRLPVTFPASENQGPALWPSQFPGTRDPRTGALDTAHFDEGIFVGYRWWDRHGQEPLFPFGHGLGYARFAVDRQSVQPDGKGGALVRANVRNLSDRAGSEVLQVYLGFPQGIGAPPKQLKGFKKVTLGPGEQRMVEIPVGAEAFRYWDEGATGWRRADGPYQVLVGISSRGELWRGTVDAGRVGG